jgi:branched-chain amino acid transport system ATP-binding protein
MSQTEIVLDLKSVEVFYEGIIRALSDVSLSVQRGEIVALLGANGAGKSTTLKAASGLLAAERGAVTGGQVVFRGRDTARVDSRKLVRDGMLQVFEGRRCFPHLTVTENLVSGTLGVAGLLAWGQERHVAQRIEEVFGRFPRLKHKHTTRAGLLSGGEQQMLAIGRALMAKPTLLLLDEPSMGLAPKLVEEVFETVAELNRSEGLSVLLAEQNARVALRYAHTAYVLESGHVVAQGSAQELRERDDVKTFYLGLNHRQRRTNESASGLDSSS